MELKDKGWIWVPIFLIGYPLYKSTKIPRPTLLVIPGMIQKVSENKWDALYKDKIILISLFKNKNFSLQLHIWIKNNFNFQDNLLNKNKF